MLAVYQLGSGQLFQECSKEDQTSRNEIKLITNKNTKGFKLVKIINNFVFFSTNSKRKKFLTSSVNAQSVKLELATSLSCPVVISSCAKCARSLSMSVLPADLTSWPQLRLIFHEHSSTTICSIVIIVLKKKYLQSYL